MVMFFHKSHTITNHSWPLSNFCIHVTCLGWKYLNHKNEFVVVLLMINQNISKDKIKVKLELSTCEIQL